MIHVGVRLTFRSALRAVLPAVKPIIWEGGTSLIPQERLVGNLELIRRAVEALPNTSDIFPTRESYLAVGYALKAALPAHGDEAWALYQAWAAKWREGANDPDIVDADWRRMKPPFRRGASWLYEMAEKHGTPGAFNAAEQWYERVEDVAPLFPVEDPAPARRFDLIPFDAAADDATTQIVRPLVKGLLDCGAMSVLYGPSNSGKSFVAADLGYHIARGLRWGGLKVTQAPVVIIAAEGARGIRKRAAALRAKYGPCRDFYFILCPVDLFHAEADVAPLIAAIAAVCSAPGLVVVDTVARTMAGGDENTAKDMGAYVENVARLQRALDCHVMLIHHTGKDIGRGARGSNALLGAIDTEIELADGRLTATKQRDMDKSFTTAFVLEPVELGRDEDGDPITSATVRLVVGEVIKPAFQPTHAQAEVLAVMTTLCEDAPHGVTPKAVGEALASVGSLIKPEGVRFHLRTLTAAGALRSAGRGHWTVNMETPAGGAGAWFEERGGIFE